MPTDDDPGAGAGGTLLTLGHGTADQDQLTRLLLEAGVELVVDIRRFPGSRRNPHVARTELERWLPDAGVAYRWAQDLGGRRSVPRDAGPPTDPWWQVAAFAAYAAYTRTDAFRDAMGGLLEDVAARRTAVMCSETVWWRCHRRLISDVAVLLHGTDVRHLAHDGRLSPHRPAAGARRTPDGLVYDVVAADASTTSTTPVYIPMAHE